MRKLGKTVEEHNYAKDPLTRADIEAIVAAVGSTGELVNTRHALVKERGWNVDPPSKAELVRAALDEPNVLRRPVLIVGDRAVVGKDEAGVRRLLA